MDYIVNLDFIKNKDRRKNNNKGINDDSKEISKKKYLNFFIFLVLSNFNYGEKIKDREFTLCPETQKQIYNRYEKNIEMKSDDEKNFEHTKIDRTNHNDFMIENILMNKFQK